MAEETPGQVVLAPVAFNTDQTNGGNPVAVQAVAPNVQREPLDPLTAWDHDMIVKQHLARLPDPTTTTNMMEPEVVDTHIKLFKIRIRDLESIVENIAPIKVKPLENELAAVYYKRKWHAWSSFPVNSLAPEILSMIFRLVIQSSENVGEANQHRLHLTWACRYWRHVAINDPTLWTSVWFKEHPPWNLALTFFERAGPCSLDVRINEPESRPDEPRPTGVQTKITVEQMEFLLDRVFLKISQIRNLVVVVNDWRPATAAVCKLSQYGPPVELERLEIHNMDPVSPPEPALTEQIALCNGFAPRLRWLSLSGVTIDWYKLPATNLSTIDLRRIPNDVCPTAAVFREMLRQSPNLFKLALDTFSTSTPLDLETEEPISLPNLRDLLLGSMDVTDVASVIANIKAPGVRSLTLMNMTDDDYGTVIEFMVGRFPEVRLLTVYTVEIVTSEYNALRLVDWMMSMPKLQFFKIAKVDSLFCKTLLEDPRDWNSPEDHSPEAQPDYPRPIICPECRFLHFQMQDFTAVMELVSERADLDVPFTKIYVPESHAQVVPAQLMRSLYDLSGQAVFVNSSGRVTEEERIISEQMEASQTLVGI